MRVEETSKRRVYGSLCSACNGDMGREIKIKFGDEELPVQEKGQPGDVVMKFGDEELPEEENGEPDEYVEMRSQESVMFGDEELPVEDDL